MNSIYFLKEGVVGNVLPRHHNIKYVDYPEGAHFGVLDIISSCFAHNIELDDWVTNHDKMKREFTVMSQRISEVLTLSVKDLETMKDDFEEQYNTLFSQAHFRLLRLLKIKSLAIKYFRVHHAGYLRRLQQETGEQEAGIDLQNQETILKVKI